MNNIAVYTIITKGKDQFMNPLVVNNNIDYYCFTDDVSSIISNTYKPIKIVDSELLTMKYHKICPMMIPIIKEYDIVIYHDGNMQILNDLSFYFDKVEEKPIALYKHPQRNCIYDEVELLEGELRSGIKKNGTLDDFYKTKTMLQLFGYPRNNGLYQCGFMIRNLNNHLLTKPSLDWYFLLKNINPRRDQLTFPIAFNKTFINILDSENEPLNKYFKLMCHSRDI